MKNKNFSSFLIINKISMALIILMSMAFIGNAASLNVKINGNLHTIFKPIDSLEINPTPFEVTLSAYVYANGFNISCFGFKDGSINTTVTGGTPPYRYKWSEGDSTPNISNLPAGYYKVEVIDANNNVVSGEITLTQPKPLQQLKLDGTVYKYPDGYNVSCNNCYNGSIDVTVYGGTGTYTYEWKDGPTTEDRTDLGAGQYVIIVRDAGSCGNGDQAIMGFALKEPQKDDWSMYGNSGIDPDLQFIGTTDMADLVLKTNNAEQFRLSPANDSTGMGRTKITGNGEVSNNFTVGNTLNVASTLKIDSLAGGGYKIDSTSDKRYKMVFADENGKLVTDLTKGNSANGCTISTTMPWVLGGNSSASSGLGNMFIGTCDKYPFKMYTFGQERMRIDGDGNVGIGTTTIPTDYKLAVYGKILCEEVAVKLHGDWPDYVFNRDYKMMTLSELEKYININKHLPNVPSADEVKDKGVNIGESNAVLLQKIEELTLYMIELNKKNEELQKKVEQLEKSSK